MPTLLNALGVGGEYNNSLSSVTLNENKNILKERLGMIMNFKKKSRFAVVMSLVLTIALSLGTGVVGVYGVVNSSPANVAYPQTLINESIRAFDIAAFEQRASASFGWLNAMDYLEIDLEGIDLLILPHRNNRDEIGTSRSANVSIGGGTSIVNWVNTYNSLSFTGGIAGGTGTGYADGDFMILYVPRNAARIFEYVNIRMEDGNVIILGADGGTNLTGNLNIEVINGDVYIGNNIVVRGDTSISIDGVMSTGHALVGSCSQHSDIIPGYTPNIPAMTPGIIEVDEEAFEHAIQMREARESDSINLGVIDLGRMTVEELEEIRNNPNHPRHNEIFGNSVSRTR